MTYYLKLKKKNDAAFNIRRIMYDENSNQSITEQLINILTKTKDNKEFMGFVSKVDTNARRLDKSK